MKDGRTTEKQRCAIWKERGVKINKKHEIKNKKKIFKCKDDIAWNCNNLGLNKWIWFWNSIPTKPLIAINTNETRDIQVLQPSMGVVVGGGDSMSEFVDMPDMVELPEEDFDGLYLVEHNPAPSPTINLNIGNIQNIVNTIEPEVEELTNEDDQIEEGREDDVHRTPDQTQDHYHPAEHPAEPQTQPQQPQQQPTNVYYTYNHYNYYGCRDNAGRHDGGLTNHHHYWGKSGNGGGHEHDHHYQDDTVREPTGDNRRSVIRRVGM